MTDETKTPHHWSRAAMAEMSELKSQVKELLTKLESSEADFMFAYETANSYQDRLIELEEELKKKTDECAQWKLLCEQRSHNVIDKGIICLVEDYLVEVGYGLKCKTATYNAVKELGIAMLQIHDELVENRKRELDNDAIIEQAEKNGLDMQTILSAYDWNIDADGKILGLVAGDMCYKETGIVIGGDYLELWKKAITSTLNRDLELLWEANAGFREQFKQDKTTIANLEKQIESLKSDNEHLYKVNAEFGEKYSKDRAIISHLEKEYDKLALYNDALLRERDIQHRINKGLLGDVRELTQKLNEVTQSEDPRITKIHDMVAEHFETSGIPVIDHPSVEHLIYVHQQDRKRIEELEEGTKNLSGALIGRGDTIKECFSKLGIDLYPSLENLIESFYKHQDFSDAHIDLLEEKIRKIEQSKTPEVDWTRFVSWDELSRMTINDIMEKVYKNVN